MAASIALALPAGCCAKPQPAPTDIRMIGDTLILNGEKTLLGGPLSEWTRRFGPPSRRLDRAGGMAVWDSLGIVATMRYPFPDSAPHVAALWFTFFHRDVDFWPARPFRGAIAYTQPRGFKDAPVTFSLRRGLTRKEIEGFDLSWRSGTDMLADGATLRFTGDGERDSLEVFFAQVQPTFARLPWEKPLEDR
jgi:hypothetical protein